MPSVASVNPFLDSFRAAKIFKNTFTHGHYGWRRRTLGFSSKAGIDASSGDSIRGISVAWELGMSAEKNFSSD
jgi:hypothetical protein